ncbi:restriction endonuclease [Streptomyces sp. NBC_00683]|uniref:restriction endonuclease n=1 Tax=Streptomyces sp. NBC_00683 TaxID=2903670 RepID=UPI002E33BC04|nr:restriction endonuclease [Streptomyces sp. NBC_00683]
MLRRPEFPYHAVTGWKLGLIILGSLGLPIVNNLASGLSIATSDPGNGFMRIQDISVSVSCGLALAIPVELIAQAWHRRQVKQYEKTIMDLKEDKRKMQLRIQELREEVKNSWLAGLEMSRAVRKMQFSLPIGHVDKISPLDFEKMIKKLMERDGLKAEVIGGRGDQAVDVLAVNLAGKRIAVQCKHTVTGRKVSSTVLYQLNGTAGDVYNASESVVVTNGHFTKDAAAWGARHGIQLIDRDALAGWSERADHLYQVVALEIPV